ncbi:MAG: hypothetical protein K2K15_01955 [Anaeroplasmataceae bacterium]|nr:hypothetical protein [Anaeroplasmataceae bacterium]
MLPLKNYQRTILYTLLHLVVDGICAAIIFKYLYTENYSTCLTVFLIYNFLAFLSQPFVGYLMDIYNRPKFFLMISILFLCLGYFLNFNYIFSAICLGIGNSFFHICGGKDVTIHSNNDIISLGIFVSTGAIGLMLGQRYVSDILIIVFISLLFVCSAFIFLAKEEEVIQTRISGTIGQSKVGFILMLILVLVVGIRSFVGKIVILDFEVAPWMFVLIAVATTLGKMTGGVVAKFIGIRKTILVSMVVAILCLCIFNTNPYSLALGIFTFNFSMPITLWYANRLFKGKEGFAFGLLAATLIPGYLLGMLDYPVLAIKLSIALLSGISVLLVIIVEKRMHCYGCN